MRCPVAYEERGGVAHDGGLASATGSRRVHDHRVRIIQRLHDDRLAVHPSVRHESDAALDAREEREVRVARHVAGAPDRAPAARASRRTATGQRRRVHRCSTMCASSPVSVIAPRVAVHEQHGLIDDRHATEPRGAVAASDRRASSRSRSSTPRARRRAPAPRTDTRARRR